MRPVADRFPRDSWAARTRRTRVVDPLLASVVQPMTADRALATYAAMQQHLYVSRQIALYRETAPAAGGNPFAYVWPHSRALLGTLALAGVPRDLPGGLDVRAAVKDRVDAL